MFKNLELAPPDPIMGITEAFKKDSNPKKINLSMGIFKDASGNTPVLNCVREAEKRIYIHEKSKSYSGIEGFPEITRSIPPLLFGEDHEVIQNRRVLSLHTPGGSGALRLAADFLKKMSSAKPTIWISDPTWANHLNIFQSSGFVIKRYPYFDAETNGLAFDQMINCFNEIPSGDAVLLHGCCHNPTGVDPTNEQWKELSQIVHHRNLFTVLDFAYQGFAKGLSEDSKDPFQLIQPGSEALICGSFSKNFALYNERTGSLTVVGADTEATEIAMSQIKVVVRSIYSSPPAHGGKIVSAILADKELRSHWESELKEMRDRIQEMRKLFAETLSAKGIPGDKSFIMEQRGMFSFSGLNLEQVQKLRNQHSVYIVGNGRINVAAITHDNIEPLCEAIAKVSL